MPKPPIYGLTGNMGCGKSTVAKFFNEFSDVVVFDADQIAKDVLRKKEYSQKLSELLGQQIFSGEKLDFRKLAQLVFNDAQILRKLEDFIHPLTWQSIYKKTIERHSGISFFLVEAALIYEANWQKFFKAVIVATCNQMEQYRRIRISMNLSDEEIAKRLNRQLLIEEKTRRADFVINTDCSIKKLQSKVQNLYHCLKGGG